MRKFLSIILVLFSVIVLFSCGGNSSNSDSQKAESVTDIASVYGILADSNLSSVYSELNSKGYYGNYYFELSNDTDKDFDRKPLSKWANYIKVEKRGNFQGSDTPILSGLAQVAFSKECAELINKRILEQGYKQSFRGDFNEVTMSGKAYTFTKGNVVISYLSDVKGLCSNKEQKVWWYIINFEEYEDNPCQESLSIEKVIDLMDNEYFFKQSYESDWIKVECDVDKIDVLGDSSVQLEVHARGQSIPFSIYIKPIDDLANLDLPARLTVAGYVSKFSRTFSYLTIDDARVYDLRAKKYLGDQQQFVVDDIKEVFGL